MSDPVIQVAIFCDAMKSAVEHGNYYIQYKTVECQVLNMLTMLLSANYSRAS